LSATVDTRDHRSHPSRGGVYRAAWTDYADRDAGTFSFHRSEAEVAHFVPLAGDRVVLAAHGWLVAADTAVGRAIPFYLQPSLGGSNTLRGFADFRFHDSHLAVVNVESRFALFTHVDAALFAGAGNVASRFADLNLDKRACGVGLRVHARQSTVARVDVARGSEGWRLLVRMNDPLQLSRLSRRSPAIPFVPQLLAPPPTREGTSWRHAA
jgi:outer membrane protein assembly factor BamA